MPQNVNKILGYFCKKNCPQKLQNIARSGHTDTYERTYLCSGKRKQNNSIEPDRQFCEKQFFVD